MGGKEKNHPIKSYTLPFVLILVHGLFLTKGKGSAYSLHISTDTSRIGILPPTS